MQVGFFHNLHRAQLFEWRSHSPYLAEDRLFWDGCHACF